MNEWISIKDRFPEKAQNVITFNQSDLDNGDFPFGYYTFFLLNGKWPGAEGVTHWMPLPELPHE